ncbi:hypothetical protein H2203_007759 [Taxawa tesnikishii (nom. ined.)]|nr:hypothetical protein H2203_007759 [Dothideales sp. JES 119]
MNAFQNDIIGARTNLPLPNITVPDGQQFAFQVDAPFVEVMVFQTAIFVRGGHRAILNTTMGEWMEHHRAELRDFNKRRREMHIEREDAIQERVEGIHEWAVQQLQQATTPEQRTQIQEHAADVHSRLLQQREVQESDERDW